MFFGLESGIGGITRTDFRYLGTHRAGSVYQGLSIWRLRSGIGTRENRYLDL
jgi:hypothetical protein